jgi:hypothetical protein
MPPKPRHNTSYYGESRRRWIIRYYDAQGKRRFHTMPEGTSEEDTSAEATVLHRKISAGVLTADRGAPSIQVVCEDYLATVKADIRASTLSMYQGHCNVHIVPHLGAMPITRVFCEALQIFKRSLSLPVSPLPHAARSSRR